MNIHRVTRQVGFLCLLAWMGFTLGACDSSEAGPPQVEPVDPLVAQALTLSLQDENRARFTYARVLMDLGEIEPFDNVVLAEIQHVAKVSGLFTDRGLDVPASDWTEDNVQTFDSRADACAAGGVWP